VSSISSADAHSSHMTSSMSEIVVVNMAELSPSSTNDAELQTQNALAGGIHSNGNEFIPKSKGLDVDFWLDVIYARISGELNLRENLG